MLNNKKRKKHIVVLIALLIVACALRIAYLNFTNKVEINMYGKGETCIYKDFSYEITDFKICEAESELEEFIPYFKKSNTPYPKKYLLLFLDIAYVGEGDFGNFDSHGIYVQSRGWSNGMEMYSIDKQKQNKLLKGKKAELCLCYELCNSGFTMTDDFWNNLDKQEYEVVLLDFQKADRLKIKK